MGSLAMNGKGAAMAKPTIRTDIHQTLDMGRHFPPEVPFDPQFLVDDIPEMDDLRFGQLIDLDVPVHIGLLENLIGRWPSNPIDVSESDLYPFILWKIDPCNTRHSELLCQESGEWNVECGFNSNYFPLSTFHFPNLALSLFMFRVFTDDPDHPLSLHDFTLIANLFNRSPDFHGFISPGIRFFHG